MSRAFVILIIIAMVMTFILVKRKIDADATTNNISAIFGTNK